GIFQDKSLIHEQRLDRENRLSVNIRLNMGIGGVANPDRRISSVSRQMIEGHLGELAFSADGVNRLKVRVLFVSAIHEVVKELHEFFHFLKLSETAESGQGKISVAQPAVAVIPVAPRTR